MILKPESKFKYQKNEQLVKLFVFLLESIYFYKYLYIVFLYLTIPFKTAIF
nr:MAG TPA: hypothetical protein [Caudoviricetes sp.]